MEERVKHPEHDNFCNITSHSGNYSLYLTQTIDNLKSLMMGLSELESTVYVSFSLLSGCFYNNLHCCFSSR